MIMMHSKQNTDPKVAIIILNWNNPDDTLACLRTVNALDYSAVSIIVVDNGSTDNSVSRICTEYPQITLIEISKNLGYAGGNNVGINYALKQGADYVWLLNDDIIVAPHSLSALIHGAKIWPDAGFLGPKVYIQEEPKRILTAGVLLNEQFLSQHRGLGELDQGQYDEVTEVNSLSGCALLVSRKVIEDIGLLDENFFAYREEVDWCYRARQAGYKNLYISQAHVWHPDTRTRDINSPLVTYYMARNRLLFARKHGLGSKYIARCLALYFLQIVNWTIQPKWRHKQRQRDALLHAVLDFSRGRFGRAEWIG
jgi:GT2 family glycosyltransferase